jgi:hypothetical protein
MFRPRRQLRQRDHEAAALNQANRHASKDCDSGDKQQGDDDASRVDLVGRRGQDSER